MQRPCPKAVNGHFHQLRPSELGFEVRPTYFAVSRDPAERRRSAYYYMRTLSPRRSGDAYDIYKRVINFALMRLLTKSSIRKGHWPLSRGGRGGQTLSGAS